MIEDVSCIRFKPQSEVNHKDFIEFLAGRGCYSQACTLFHARIPVKMRIIKVSHFILIPLLQVPKFPLFMNFRR